MANFEYDLPIGHWQALSPLPPRLTRGWRFLGIFSAQTGFPFTVGSSYGSLQYGYDVLAGWGARPFFLQRATLNPGGGPQVFSHAVIGNSGTEAIGDGFFGLPNTLVLGIVSICSNSDGVR